MSARSRARLGRGEQGRGVIAFIIALVLLIFGARVLKEVYSFKSKYNTLDDYAYETLGNAERQKLSAEDIRSEILKKARELNVPIKRADDIQVSRETTRWQLRVEWDDTLVLPGYSRTEHFVIDKSWTRY